MINHKGHFSWSGSVSESNDILDLLAILKKNLNRMTFVYISKNFRMCTIAIEALTPLDRAWGIKCIKISLDPGSFVE